MLGTLILITFGLFTIGMAALAWTIVHAGKKSSLDNCEECGRDRANCGRCSGDVHLSDILNPRTGNAGNLGGDANRSVRGVSTGFSSVHGGGK